MPAPYPYDEQRYVSEDDSGLRGSRQYQAQPNMARYERYEIDPPSLKARQDDMKGKKVTFCMSGDKDCKGVDLCINNKIRTFGSLLAELDKHPKIKPKGGVRYVFRKDENNRYKRIEDLGEIQSGDLLVVSDRARIDKTIDYGFPLGPSPTKSLQRSPLPRRSTKVNAPFRRSLSRKNDTIIVMNKERMLTYKVNPNTTQLFEQVLDDIGDMLKLSSYKPLSMHSITPGVYNQIDSFTKLNSQLHTTELRSSGKETPKFVVCKSGEHPEDALSEKLRKAYEKKGLIKPNDNGPMQNGNGRYDDDDEEPGYDQVEDGAPEPEKHPRGYQRSKDYGREPSPQRRHQRSRDFEREQSPQRRNQRNREYDRDPSPPKQVEEPQTARRPTQRQNGLSKSQSKENVGSKQTTGRTPRQAAPPSKPQTRKQPPQRRQVEEETSSESQQNQEESGDDSDSDYPTPRLLTPKRPKERVETPEC
ncbi:activating signal cointegrator 1 complex subunit 2 homolog [Mytilus californianus]|uniref:activating signal cointegrator 1 complex subunit 2 homolog n=1 Tax=Mytilus californianus TaxID=6549 RepID=UPI00224778EC|nr:activating signal cointegrator 1 complex subunit 2 homolog [Mytilus californianus]